MDVWLLDVGQGSCSYVACPDGKSALLIDCGSSAVGGTPLGDIGAWVSSQLEGRTSATVLVSHPDKDHMSLLGKSDGITPNNITGLYVGRALSEYPVAFTAWAAKTQTSPEMFSAAEFKQNDSRFTCGAAKVDLLTVNTTMNPSTGELGTSKNTDSAVVRLSYAGSSVIFPGDAEGKTERKAIENAHIHNLSLTGNTLLIGSHHGAKTEDSNSQEWLDAIAPHTELFSARLASSYHHPQCEVIDRASASTAATQSTFDVPCGVGSAQTAVRAVSSRILSTNDNGHILAKIGSGGTTIYCQKLTPACDEQLNESELPRAQ
jgi:beta-lactamase superfamily II metal-dependent hydrolase